MEICQCILTDNTCYQRNLEAADSRYTRFQRRGPLGIMLHSTGANNPALRRYLGPDDGIIGKNAYGNHWNRPDISACVHAFIGLDAAGEVRTYQTLPWNYRGWHCGGSGNDTHVSIEICEDALEDEAYLNQCMEQAALLTAKLCEMYSLDPLAEGVILDHAEAHSRAMASNHSDIQHWLKKFGKTMDGFRQEVARCMAHTGKPDTECQKPTDDSPGDPSQENSADLTQLIDSRIRLNRKIAVTMEELPDWARESVSKLVERGIVRGNGDGLELSEDLVRMVVILDRLGLTESIQTMASEYTIETARQSNGRQTDSPQGN